jgi:hypothetical protein
MNRGIDRLTAIVAAHLREWEPSPPFVELAIFDSADARCIAAMLNTFCIQTLGSSVATGLFHQSSIGSVTGAVLQDGRSLVIKAHQPDRSREFLAEVVRVQSYLAERGLFATKVIAGPLPLGRGHAVVEAFADIGGKADAHHPEIRNAVAVGLHAIVQACDALAARWRRACSDQWVMRYGLRPTASSSTLPRPQRAPSGLTTLRHARANV